MEKSYFPVCLLHKSIDLASLLLCLQYISKRKEDKVKTKKKALNEKECLNVCLVIFIMLKKTTFGQKADKKAENISPKLHNSFF